MDCCVLTTYALLSMSDIDRDDFIFGQLLINGIIACRDRQVIGDAVVCLVRVGDPGQARMGDRTAP